MTLELSSYFGISLSQNDLRDLGDECLIEGIRFFQCLDALKNHKFIPRTLFIGFRENLVGADQLTKAFLKMLTDRNDSWYSELYELQPRQRGNKLAEYHKIIDFQIQKIHDTFYVSDLYDVKSKEILLLSAIDTLAMSIARHVSQTSFSDYGEEALLGHILACQECVRYFSTLRIYPYSGKLAGSVADLAVGAKDKWVMALSRVCIEQVGGSFLRSANEAATAAVQTVAQTSQDIVNMFFLETGGWIGGRVVHALLDRVDGWMEAFCHRGASKPCEFHRIIRRETIRLVVVTYIRKLIEKYRLNKKFKLSGEGEMQVASDLQIIGRWVEQTNEKLIPSYVSDRGSYTGSNDVTMLIRNTRLFMTSDEDSILLCFVESIQHFGLSCAPHLYDLARLAMKIRSDLHNKVRLNTLGSFGCYISKLTAATIEGFGPLSHPHPRISGPSILQELFPNVGVTHCTGKKWSYEKLQDPDGTLSLEISTLVTDACNVARIRRAAYRDSSSSIPKLVEEQSFSSSITQTTASTDAESGDTWQLLDPDHLRMEHGPLDTERPSLQAMFEERDRLIVSDAAISLLDAAEFNDPSQEFTTDVSTPFVDLYGCSFEELHHSLRPRMYDDHTFHTPTLLIPSRVLSCSSLVQEAQQKSVFSDEDSVSEDEFGGFDGVYYESERSLNSPKKSPKSRLKLATEEGKSEVIVEKWNTVVMPSATPPTGSEIEEVDAVDDVIIELENEKERMGNICVGSSGACEEPFSSADSASETVSSKSYSVVAGEDAHQQDNVPAEEAPCVRSVPPVKPPKPRRYSHCEPLEPSPYTSSTASDYEGKGPAICATEESQAEGSAGGSTPSESERVDITEPLQAVQSQPPEEYKTHPT